MHRSSKAMGGRRPVTARQARGAILAVASLWTATVCLWPPTSGLSAHLRPQTAPEAPAGKEAAEERARDREVLETALLDLLAGERLSVFAAEKPTTLVLHVRNPEKTG